MNKNGDILIIEDDEDDQLLFEEAFNSLNYVNKRRYFPDGLAALDYLHSTKEKPFLILSDINLPKLNGLELKAILQNDVDLSIKFIPYLFFSTAISQKAVIEAYSKSAQGFFLKLVNFSDLVDTLKIIMEYWRKCEAPNNF